MHWSKMVWEYNISSMYYVWEDYKLSSALRNNVCNDNKLYQPRRKAFKCTLAPRQCSKTKLWTMKMEMIIAAIARITMKRRWDSVSLPRSWFRCHLQRSVTLYCCGASFTKHLQEDHDAQRLHINNMYGTGSLDNFKSCLQWLWFTEGWWRRSEWVRSCLQWRKAISAQPLWSWQGQRVTALT